MLSTTKTIQKRNCRTLPALNKKIAMTAIANRFVDERSKERRRADDDEDEADYYWAFVESRVVDSSLLPSNIKDVFTKAFGTGTTEFDFGDTSVSADVDYHSTGKLNRVNIYEDGKKTVIDASELNKTENTSKKEMVVQTIDLGKGGRQKFMVPAECAL